MPYYKMKLPNSDVFDFYCNIQNPQSTIKRCTGLLAPNLTKFKVVEPIPPNIREFYNNKTHIVEVINIVNHFFFVEGGQMVFFLDGHLHFFRQDFITEYWNIEKQAYRRIENVEYPLYCLIDETRQRFSLFAEINEITENLPAVIVSESLQPFDF